MQVAKDVWRNAEVEWMTGVSIDSKMKSVITVLMMLKTNKNQQFDRYNKSLNAFED